MPHQLTDEELARQSLVYTGDLYSPVWEIPEWVMLLGIVLVEFSAVFTVTLAFAQ